MSRILLHFELDNISISVNKILLPVFYKFIIRVTFLKIYKIFAFNKNYPGKFLPEIKDKDEFFILFYLIYGIF